MIVWFDCRTCSLLASSFSTALYSGSFYLVLYHPLIFWISYLSAFTSNHLAEDVIFIIWNSSFLLFYTEANEMAMELGRRRRLASQYSLKICSCLSNPARNCAFDERFTKLFDKRPNQIRFLGLRVKTDLSAIGFKQKDIFTSPTSTVPPWLFNRPLVDLSLNDFAKSETNAVVF